MKDNKERLRKRNVFENFHKFSWRDCERETSELSFLFFLNFYFFFIVLVLREICFFRLGSCFFLFLFSLSSFFVATNELVRKRKAASNL